MTQIGSLIAETSQAEFVLEYYRDMLVKISPSCGTFSSFKHKFSDGPLGIVGGQPGWRLQRPGSFDRTSWKDTGEEGWRPEQIFSSERNRHGWWTEDEVFFLGGESAPSPQTLKLDLWAQKQALKLLLRKKLFLSCFALFLSFSVPSSSLALASKRSQLLIQPQ